MIPSIDFVGTVTGSSHPKMANRRPNGTQWTGVGEKQRGGLSQKARVKGDWLIALTKATLVLRKDGCSGNSI